MAWNVHHDDGAINLKVANIQPTLILSLEEWNKACVLDVDSVLTLPLTPNFRNKTSQSMNVLFVQSNIINVTTAKFDLRTKLVETITAVSTLILLRLMQDYVALPSPPLPKLITMI